MIQKMLDASTTHINEETYNWILKQTEATKENKMDLIVYKKEDYGVFIPLHSEMLEGKVFPEPLVFLIGYAMGKGCSWIMLDYDGVVIDELPKYS